MPQVLAIGTFVANFVDPDFSYVAIYGGICIILVLFLIILSRILRFSFGSKVKNTALPFAMTREDIERMKEEGEITDEEYKRIKETMSKRFIERVKAEEEARKRPGRADAVLKRAEDEVRAKSDLGILEDEPEASPVGKEEKASSPKSAPARAPLTRSPEPPQPEAVTEEPVKPRSGLPSHLEPLLEKTDLELEDLRDVGFLSEEDMLLLRKAKKTS